MELNELINHTDNKWFKEGIYEVTDVMKADMGSPICVAFSGSRNRNDEKEVRKILSNYNPSTDTIVHGGCPKGVDSTVDKIAKEMDFKIIVFEPQGRGSKYLLKRNEHMAKGNAMWLHALPERDKRALDALANKITRGGTEHTIRQFLSVGKRVYVHLNIGRIITRSVKEHGLNKFV